MLSLRRHLPNLMIAVAVVLIMIGAYAAVAFSESNVPKATWLKNPLPLTFQGTPGRGGTVTSVTCNHSATGLTLNVHITKPDMIALTLAPNSFTCDSTPTIITVTAACLVSGTLCRGNYQGTVRLRQSSNYRDIPANLQVDIAVT